VRIYCGFTLFIQLGFNENEKLAHKPLFAARDAMLNAAIESACQLRNSSLYSMGLSCFTRWDHGTRDGRRTDRR